MGWWIFLIGISFIVGRNEYGDSSSNPGRIYSFFTLVLMTLGKAWSHLTSLQLEVNTKTDCFLRKATSLEEEKIEFKPAVRKFVFKPALPGIEIDLVSHPACGRGLGKYIYWWRFFFHSWNRYWKSSNDTDFNWFVKTSCMFSIVSKWRLRSWFSLGLRYINHFGLFNAKSSLLIYIRSIRFALVWFYGTSTIAGYLMPNPLY